MNRSIFIACITATGLVLASAATEAAPPRAELLAERSGAQNLDSRQVDRGGRHDPRRDARYNNGGYDARYDDAYNNRHRNRGGPYRYGDSARYGEQRAMAKARRYAAIAVDQARQARRLGIYPDHPRWSLNFDRHCRWALHAAPWKLEREIRRRAGQLREWRRHGYGHAYGNPYAPH